MWVLSALAVLGAAWGVLGVEQALLPKIRTKSPSAQALFNQGLLLAFGYNQPEARKSFAAALSYDPACAMCWWGLAYARGENGKGAGAPPPRPDLPWPPASLRARERHYVAAMADRLALRQTWGAEWAAAEKRFAQDMADIAACWLDDADAPALAAEALANTSPWDFFDPRTDAPREATPLVLSLLNESLWRDPRQPLTLHLHRFNIGAWSHPIIHVTEALPAGRGPARAGVAEPSADTLHGLLPGFDHLQHMPSHTFIRVGRWADAVEANLASLRAATLGSHMCLASMYPDHDAAMGVFAASMAADLTRADVYARVLKELPRFIRDAPASVGSQWGAPLPVWVRFAQWHAVLQVPPPPVAFNPATAAVALTANVTAGWRSGLNHTGVVRHPAADVAADPALDAVLRYPPPAPAAAAGGAVPYGGPLRGPLGDTEYTQDGAEYARVLWHFSRLMALAAQLASKQDQTEAAASAALLPYGNGTAGPDAAAMDAASALASATLTGRREVAAEFEALRSAVALVPPDTAGPPGQGLGINVPGYRLMAAVLGLVAEARLAVLDANLEAAAQALVHAVDVEGSGGYYEPPRLGPQPVRQCLGWVLLRAGRLREALQTYLEDLSQFPYNPWSIRGLHEALPAAAAALEAQQAQVEGQAAAITAALAAAAAGEQNATALLASWNSTAAGSEALAAAAAKAAEAANAAAIAAVLSAWKGTANSTAGTGAVEAASGVEGGGAEGAGATAGEVRAGALAAALAAAEGELRQEREQLAAFRAEVAAARAAADAAPPAALVAVAALRSSCLAFSVHN
ncbi:hypothetical protein TSOC_002057 [Tetrabaena socialis]|uniref:Uncharacterized protein n=1 Tax=Tetrabaena socialis TaxID=47790 RepID=A0A2J8AF53_9CHLO|nr:hypothetical protein TSOC_002057 [Tetrabaena socialis]|eukprot:PNH11132.1 hypothetical protein TSOC_002057 [Tetrabaena socialis]